MNEGFLVIEGPDGAGKSYLAAELGVRYGAFVSHTGVPKTTNPTWEYLNALVELREKQERVILDRFHLGCDVYGPMFRGKPDMDDFWWDTVDSILRRAPGLLVVLDPPASWVLGNLQKKADEGSADQFDDPNKAQQLRGQFYDAYKKSYMSKIMIDPTKPEDVVNLWEAVEMGVLKWAPKR